MCMSQPVILCKRGMKFLNKKEIILVKEAAYKEYNPVQQPEVPDYF